MNKNKTKKKKQPLVQGIYLGTNRGFGFVRISEEEEDIFIPRDGALGAMDQDEVEVALLPGRKDGRRQEGYVHRILRHSVTEIVGTYERYKKHGFVTSDNKKINLELYIPDRDRNHAKDGDKVVAVIRDYGSPKRSPEGAIKEILGKEGSKGTDILSLIRSAGIPDAFPEKVLRQAERVPEKISEADLGGRRDLRSLSMVTIDGEDAKDLDDAVSLTWTEDGFSLGVHIADVSNYVQADSALDKEALHRGTSVYLPDRVVPMLPKRLSNGICSLNAGEDRLALSCLMEFDAKGKLLSHEITEAVICVDRRMSYTEVNALLTGKDAGEAFASLVPMLKTMHRLSRLIRGRRRRRGAIDFDFPECKILLDARGRAVDIVPHESNAATEMIEDFMLMANETVAQEYWKAKLPFLYRTHEQPDEDKVEELLLHYHQLGLPAKKRGQAITPREVRKLLSLAQGRPEEAQLSRMTLRTMKQARYGTECIGHFGLAAKYYCHFTSPIRRYPDLMIHRIIKDQLRGRMKREGRKDHYQEILEGVAQQSSMCERRSQELEREADKLKKTEYMTNHLGECFDGVISGVTGWGIYVELPNTVEGLVHVNSLRDDHYEYDEEKDVLRGQRSGRELCLGQKVRVRAQEADVSLRTIDFSLL